MTLKEALESGYCSLDDEFDFDDTPQGEEIACLKLEIERLNNIINKIDEYVNKLRYYADEDDKEYMISKDIHNIIQELKGSDKKC